MWIKPGSEPDSHRANNDYWWISALSSDNKIDNTSPGHYRWGALLSGPLATATLLALPAPGGMAPDAWVLVALTSWIVAWWLSEAVPIAATSLLPIILMPLFGVGDIDAVSGNYANPIIFLFLGGFLLAEAMQKSGLHRRIALRTVSLTGSRQNNLIGGFMAATAFLSMWISNTSATIMMFAVALSVTDFVSRNTQDSADVRRFGVALMLGIAYAATIGGVGTLIGTPPNAFLASYMADTYGIQIDFLTWMKFALPIVLVMLPLTWLVITRWVFPSSGIGLEGIEGLIERELVDIGPMKGSEKVVAAVYLCTAAGWIFRTQLASLTGLPISDTTIALSAALVLFMWPTPAKRNRLLEWSDAKQVPWEVLLLFGGGLALAGAFDRTGLSAWIGSSVIGFDMNPWLLVLAVTVSVVYLTEITSNTASTAAFLPVLGAAAVGMGLNPLLLTVPAAVAASMAFMMPVATPPNAIVFSYEQMRLGDMVRAGMVLNVVGTIVAFAGMYFLAGMVFAI